MSNLFHEYAGKGTIRAMVPVIVQSGDPVLRKKAAEVPLADIKTAKMRKILKDMEAALNTQDDGVAIAAPQIGVSLRIFLVAKAALSPLKKGALPASAGGLSQPPKAAPFSKGDKQKAGVLAFINPIISKLSRDKATVDEGCLSVRPLYGKIQRSKKASIQAYDENGNFFERGAAGLLAQIFQHETDHLEGILFIDKATDLREMPPHDESRSEN